MATPKTAKATPAKAAAPRKRAAKKAAAPRKATKATPMNGKDPIAPTRTAMSDEHKSALAVGRDQGRAVRRYLEALSVSKPKRGRKRTPESMERRLAVVQATIPGAEPIRRLALIQERIDLQAALEAKEQAVDLSELEAGFIEVGADYATRKGYSYAAFQELGVSPDVLKRARISRS